MQNIYDYTGIFRAAMTHGEADEIATKLQDFEWTTHGNTADRSIEYDVDTDFSVAHETAGDDRMRTIMSNVIDGALVRYRRRHFCGVNNRSVVRFNKNDTNTKMELNIDHMHSLFDGDRRGIPILSMMGVLNDDFEGGMFVFNEHKEVRLEKGDVLIFPSNFIYRHKVRLVTSGTRYSWMSWAY